MEEKILEIIKRYNLIENGDKIVVGVSGGPDSITLLNILKNIKEKEIIKSLKNQKGKIIATGGGVILDNKNIKNLKENGLIIYLKRPLNKLVISNTRPLSDNINKIKKLYKERKDIYEHISDITLYNNSTIDKIYNDFILKFKKYR